MHRWFCAQIRREQIAIRGLTEQGFEHFHPMMATTRIRHGRVVEGVEAVFPKYLFLRSEPDPASWRAINNTRGVIRLLGNDEPCALPHGEIEQLRERERAGLLCHAKRRPIRVGDEVEFRCGSFVGLHGVCQWTKRERIGVLMQVLGGETTVKSPRDWLKLAA